MGMAGVDPADTDRYIQCLRTDEVELDLLAKDLLINVTSFFRDAHVFAFLADTIVPDLVRDHASGQPIRIWIAGCSTGEETYSIAMLFREVISAAKSDIKLQVFASDVDPDAVAVRAKVCIPKRSRRRSRKRGSNVSLRRKTSITGFRRNCVRP